MPASSVPLSQNSVRQRFIPTPRRSLSLRRGIGCLYLRLHKQVMRTLAENGGKVPAALRD